MRTPAVEVAAGTPSKKYKDPRMIDKSDRTEISFWQTNGEGEYERIRLTFGLSRIKDKKSRKAKANTHINVISTRLASGEYYDKETKSWVSPEPIPAGH